MENTNPALESMKELHKLCPTLEKIKKEQGNVKHYKAVERMVLAYIENGGKERIGTYNLAVLYLKHLAQVEKETLAKFTIKGVENA